tara:strand:- start:178 stop:747 length:570 start_codon:yes stop_codon:yes gene_type:complete
MIKIGILGDIGSGKSFVAKNFGYPVFNADKEVADIYKHDKKTFNKLKKILPKYFKHFPIEKKIVIKSILDDRRNLKRIIKIIHKEISKKLKLFLKKNKNKKIVILDIPLLLENKLNKKKDILIFVDAKKSESLKRLKKRKNFNYNILKIFKSAQLPLKYKRNKCKFIIKNNFIKKNVKIRIKYLLKKII